MGYQSTNCITRDAQNVFDKKRMRFEKIKKMRQQSADSEASVNNSVPEEKTEKQDQNKMNE